MLLASEGQDIKLAESRFETGRNFANKLWNASRFAIMNLVSPEGVPGAPPKDDFCFEDRWILSRLNRTVGIVSGALDEYRLNQAASALYTFVWREFCDWYLEIVKPRLYDEGDDDAALRSRAAARYTLAKTLGVTLRLLHPMIPFVTEEIHRHKAEVLGRSPHSISRGSWPKPEEAFIDEAVDAEMETMIELVRAVRNIRAEMRVPDGARLAAYVSVKDEGTKDLVMRHAGRFAHLARLETLEAGVGLAKPPASATKVVGEMEVYLPLGDVIDLGAELDRLKREREKVESQVRVSERKLENRDFLEKAPAEVVERERARRDEIATRLEAVQKHVTSLEELM
jgi:valyl-tRNA synthetase